MKKSHVLLLGSLLVFGGVVFLTRDYFVRLKGELYSDMLIKMSLKDGEVSDVSNEGGPVSSGGGSSSSSAGYDVVDYTIDYSKYFGVLEISKIGLKRGFYNVGSKYNNVEQNVTMVAGSAMPNQETGRLILMAHSGDAYVSFFANLYKLDIGDDCYITYDGQAYHFVIKKIYNVEKNGLANIDTNPSVFSLVLITCTKDSNTSQTIYIAENVG